MQCRPRRGALHAWSTSGRWNEVLGRLWACSQGCSGSNELDKNLHFLPSFLPSRGNMTGVIRVTETSALTPEK